jgi:FkbM family methyltransferase
VLVLKLKSKETFPGGAPPGIARMSSCGKDGEDCKAWDCQFEGQRVQDRALFEVLGGVALRAPGKPCKWGVERTECLCVAPTSLFGRERFYAEVGGHDGVYLSNSVFFDREMGWSGVLVEGNPVTFPQMVSNRPNAISVHAVVSGDPTSPWQETHLKFFSFKTDSWQAMMSGIEGSSPEGPLSDLATAQRYAKENEVELVVSKIPVRSFADIFREHSVTDIDFMSIDVEGHELAVIASIDFNKVRVGLVVVEKDRSPYPAALVNNGFVDVSWALGSETTDYLFAHCNNLARQGNNAALALVCTRNH